MVVREGGDFPTGLGFRSVTLATPRQIAANRRNASLSKGPVSAEGKQRSSRNALKHGLAGEGVILPLSDEERVTRRLEAWRTGHDPTTPEGEWVYEQLVRSSVRVDACQAREAALRSYQAQRAALAWREDRAVEAEKFAASLSKRPALVACQLSGTKSGCVWLMRRWEDVVSLGDVEGSWTEPARSLAFDLLGRPIDGRIGDPGLSPARLAEAERARLEERIAEGMEALDAIEREAAVEGISVLPDRELDRLRRYEAACHRRLEQASRKLATLTRSSNPVADPEPAPPAPAAPLPSPLDASSDSILTEIERRGYQGTLMRMIMDSLIVTAPVPTPVPNEPNGPLGESSVMSGNPEVGSKARAVDPATRRVGSKGFIPEADPGGLAQVGLDQAEGDLPSNDPPEPGRRPDRCGVRPRPGSIRSARDGPGGEVADPPSQGSRRIADDWEFRPPLPRVPARSPARA